MRLAHAGKAKELPRVLADIAASGYGLTLGVHSRIETTIKTVTEALDTGNVYVNRNIIGALVGTQPFGGSGLSGTGFKAGGPAYLQRFALEQVISVNTAGRRRQCQPDRHGRRLTSDCESPPCEGQK